MSHNFISYDPEDGKEFAISLYNQLESGVPKLSTWVCDLHLLDSQNVTSEVREAIKTCKSFILTASPKLEEKKSRCYLELRLAVSYQKPILIILPSIKYYIPAKINSRRKYSLFSNNDIELTRLKQTLVEIDSARNKLITLEEYLGDALFEYQYEIDEFDKLKIQDDIYSFEDQISTLRRGI